MKEIIMTELWLKPRGHAPSRLSVKKLIKTSVTQKGKLRMVFEWKGIQENIISYYSSEFTINPKPQSRSVHSCSVFWPVSSSSQCCLSQLTYQNLNANIGRTRRLKSVPTILTETVLKQECQVWDRLNGFSGSKSRDI